MVIRLIESRRRIHVRRTGQSSIETVSPGMIRALNRGDMPARFLFQSRSSMAADVEEATDYRLLITNHNHAFASHAGQEKISRFRKLALMPHHQPVLRKNPLLFLREDLGRNEILLRKVFASSR